MATKLDLIIRRGVVDGMGSPLMVAGVSDGVICKTGSSINEGVASETNMSADPSELRGNYVTARMSFARRDVDATAFSDDARSLAALEQHEVNVVNGRRETPQKQLASSGFALVRHKTKLSEFSNDIDLKDRYAPELEELVVRLTGASRVFVVDMVLRGTKEMSEANPDTRMYEYAFKAHTDADGRGFFKHIETKFPDQAKRYERCAFVAYNVWRPVTPIMQKPLALCDASSVAVSDLMPAFYDGWKNLPPEKRPNPLPASGRYFHLAHNPGQRWYYFPEMTPEEVLVFKQWDTDGTRPLAVPHTAFEDANSPFNATPRMSIEARTVAFFDDTPPTRRLSLDPR